MINVWLDALVHVLSLINLFTIISGTLVGIVFGALPGLGPTLAVALMISVSFNMSADTALILLGAVYSGAIYGGSISAILLNAPGTPGSAATTFDGYPMSQNGQAGVALGISATASMVGGIFSVICLILFAPLIAQFSIRFGPPELFILAIFALSIIAALSSSTLRRGLIAGGLGLILSFFGQDLMTGQSRFDFGILSLQDGIPFVVGLIGMFATSEAISLAERQGSISQIGKMIGGGVKEGIRLTFKYPVTLVRSSIIGTIIGAVPGAGIAAANFLAYMETVRSSKNPESFGTGNPEGVVASEASNNAVSGGSLIPTLTLGIPGNAVTAAFLGGVMIHGMRPGMDLFSINANITYALFIGLILANIVFFIVGICFTGLFSKITLVRNELLVPLIFILSIIGAFAINNRFSDIVICIIFGFLGYFLKKYGFPVIVVVLGMILGPIGERGFQQSLMMSGGSFLVFFSRPISLILLILTVMALFSNMFKDQWNAHIKRRFGNYLNKKTAKP